MAGLHAATKTYLKADATLYTVGGTGLAKNILDITDVGREGLKIDNLKAAGQSGQPKIAPSIYLNWVDENPMPNAPSAPDGSVLAVRGFLEIYFYEHMAYTTITAMRRRVYTLLHQQRVVIDGPDYLYAFIWAGDVLEQDDPYLEGVSMERSRFEFHYLRR